MHTPTQKANDMTEGSISQTINDELARYGIERVPADVFLWRGYRYTNAHDALAAAKLSPAK